MTFTNSVYFAKIVFLIYFLLPKAIGIRRKYFLLKIKDLGLNSLKCVVTGFDTGLVCSFLVSVAA